MVQGNRSDAISSQAPAQVSLIVFHDHPEPLSKLRLAVMESALQRFNNRIQLKGIIGPLAYGHHDQVSRYESISEALNHSTDDHLLLVDSGFSFRPELLQLLLSESDSVTLVQETPQRLPFWRRLVFAFFQFLNRILLGFYHAPYSSIAISISTGQLQLARVSESPQKNLRFLPAMLITENIALASSQVVAPLNAQPSGVGPIGFLREMLQSYLDNLRFWWNEFKFPGQDHTISHPSPGWTMKSSVPWVTLLLLAVFLLGRNLSYPLFEPDETRNAQLALNILQSGEWWSLKLDGSPYWDKPPLVAWLTAGSYSIFGVNEFATRLPTNLAAMGSVLLTFGLGRRILGSTSAWIGSVCLLLSAAFVFCGRYVTMDSMLTFTALGTLYSAHLATRGSRFRNRWWLMSSIFGGLGLLAKGPVVVVITLPVLILNLILRGDRKLWCFQRWLMYSVPVMLIAGPWYIASGLVQPEFVTYFFWKHHVLRFSEAFNHHEPWWYYGPVLMLGMFPASFLLPSLVSWTWSNGVNQRSRRNPDMGFLCLAGAWPLLFFSISEAKLPTYILPAFPSIALLMGTVLQQRLLGRPEVAIGWTWLERSASHASRWLVLLAAGSIGYLYFSSGLSIWAWVGLGLLMAIVGLLAWIVHDRTAPNLVNWGSVGLLAVLTLSLVFDRVIPTVAESRSIHMAASQIQTQPELAGLPIVYFDHEDYGSRFWLQNRRIYSFTDDDRHLFWIFAQSHPRAILISRSQKIEILQRSLKWPQAITRIDGARHLFLMDLRDEKTLQPKIAERTGLHSNLLR